jgi:SHS2 domain-containing protein
MRGKSRARYRFVPTTADVGLVARGEAPEAVMAAAIEGLGSLLLDRRCVRMREERRVEADGPDLVELAHLLLENTLTLLMVERYALRRCHVELSADRRRATAILLGEPLDLERHRAHGEVKGVTWHRFSLEPDGRGWLLRVIFDV